MDGKKLIEYICELLDNQDKRLTDSNIVIQLRTMTQHELTTLVNKRSKLRQDAILSSVCEPCKYRFTQDYHGKMRCRDCQQGSNFEQTDL